MAEELRMKVAVDGESQATGAFKRLQAAAAEVKPTAGMAAMKAEVLALTSAVKGAAGAGWGVALGGMGFGAISAAGAMASLVANVLAVSKATSALKQTSRETGLTVDQLRVLTETGEHLGVSTDTMTKSLSTLGDKMVDFRRNHGDLFDSLRVQTGMPGLFKQLMEDGDDFEKQLGHIFGALEKIKGKNEADTENLRQQWAEKIFGNRDIAKLFAKGPERLQEELGGARKRVAETSSDELLRLEKERNIRLKEFNDELDRFTRTVAPGMLGIMVKLMKAGGEAANTANAIVDVARDPSKSLEKGPDGKSKLEVAAEGTKSLLEQMMVPGGSTVVQSLADWLFGKGKGGGTAAPTDAEDKAARDKLRTGLEEMKRDNLRRSVQEGTKEGVLEALRGNATVQQQSLQLPEGGGLGGLIQKAGLGGGAWGTTSGRALRESFGSRGGGGGNGGALPVIPDTVPMTATERNTLGLIMKYESHGQNTMNYVGRRQGLDPAAAKGYTAQGYFQMLNSNWRRIAPGLGIKAPNAMAGSLDDQTRVALTLLRRGGVGNWTSYNAALRAALGRGEKAGVGAVPSVSPSTPNSAPATADNPGRRIQDSIKRGAELRASLDRDASRIRTATTSRQTVRHEGGVNIALDMTGVPRGTRVATDRMSGIVQDVTIRKGEQMTEAA